MSVVVTSTDPILRIEAPTLASAAEAGAVVDILEDRLRTTAVPRGDTILHHDIILADQTETGLPSGLSDALNISQGASAQEIGSVTRAFQPGWFWLRVGSLEGGAAVIDRWVRVIEDVVRAHTDEWSNKPGLWDDEDGVFIGESALLPLALQDATWLPHYTRLLRVWQLGHEVHIRASIAAIVARHDWSANLAEMLVTRASIDGQHGADQVFGDLRPTLREALTEADYEAFYLTALSAFREFSRSWFDWPPAGTPRGSFSITGDLLPLAHRVP